MASGRIYLSPPHLDGNEAELVIQALKSNWIAPTGPEVTAFEHDVAAAVSVSEAAALCSGTAALHLALVLLRIGPGDDVLCSDLTFAAPAFAIRYVGANPVFVDCEASSWQMHPGLLEEELDAARRRGKLPKAIVVVDLYGQCADYERILAAARRHEVPVIEDAAEALGAAHDRGPAGSLGHFGVVSFNGNKIITTSGGGMLVSDDENAIARARMLASQAREPAPHYEHETLGYNYRMSNLLAALGRAQLRHLKKRVAARRRNFELYEASLGELPGFTFMPEAGHGTSNRWLTALTIEPAAAGVDREQVRLALEAEDIESRPVWKPMHLQPVFSACRVVGGGVGASIFERGLCLPSGSDLSETDLQRVVEIVRRTAGAKA